MKNVMRSLLVIVFIGISIITFCSNEGYALVLSGGGAKGAYQIGVWKALKQLAINIKGAYGTSVGAINAAAVVLEEYEQARTLWLNIDYDDVMDLSPELEDIFRGHLSNMSFSDLEKGIGQLLQGIDIDPLRNELDEIISESEVRQSEIDYGLVAFCVSDMKPRTLHINEIPEGELIDYILASAGLPIFKHEEIKGKVFVDGGVYNNIPINLALDRGFENIIIVDIGNIGDLPTRITNFIENRKYDGEYNAIFIRPRKFYGNMLTFDSDVASSFIKEGYLDTLAAFNFLEGENFYIYMKEDILFHMFLSLSSELRAKALKIMSLESPENVSPEYQYYRLLLPQLEHTAGTVSEHPIKTSLKIVEDLANYLQIDSLKPYDSYSIIKIIDEKTDNKPKMSLLKEFIEEMKYGKVLDLVDFLFENSNYIFPKDDRYNEIVDIFNDLTNIEK
ncbi:MAG: patatin-like phospholipase family protein [Kosmotogaceae bacterium]